ncbi:MAG TPA: hypothetical protein VFG16_33810, partial [Streptomyces sp.]|nr:hypothetical protein [Streptomyces sp.]
AWRMRGAGVGAAPAVAAVAAVSAVSEEAEEAEEAEGYDFLPVVALGELEEREPWEVRWAALKEASGGLMAEFPPAPVAAEPLEPPAAEEPEPSVPLVAAEPEGEPPAPEEPGPSAAP